MEYTVDDLRGVLRDTDSVVFSDPQLELYRSQFPDSIWRAASFAIRSLAIEYSASGKSIKTDDLSINLTSRGSDLLGVADSFSEQADAADAAEVADFFQVVPFSSAPSAVRPEGTPWPSPLFPVPVPVNPNPGFGEGGFGY